MGIESMGFWDELVADKDKFSVRELAERYGVSAGAISLALKKTGTSKIPQGSEPIAPPSATNRPGSKDYLLEPLLELMGAIPDAEVAKRAGVSVRTVASYRSRNNISGYTGRGKPGQRKQRRSRIDPFVDLLGTVPDRVVAAKAGVTLNAVRNYRAKRGIPSSRQRAREQAAEAPAVVAPAAPTPVTPEPVVEAVPAAAPAAVVAVRTSTEAALGYVWEVEFEAGSGGIVTGSSIADAAQKAQHLGDVTHIRRLGVLLA